MALSPSTPLSLPPLAVFPTPQSLARPFLPLPPLSPQALSRASSVSVVELATLAPPFAQALTLAKRSTTSTASASRWLAFYTYTSFLAQTRFCLGIGIRIFLYPNYEI